MSLVGLLYNLVILTRPDLLYSLSRVAQATSNPTESDLLKVSSKDYGFTYSSNNDFKLYCNVDAIYNCYEDRKSPYGYTISLGKQNGPYCAKSAKISLVCMSSTEAEYVTCCDEAQELACRKTS